MIDLSQYRRKVISMPAYVNTGSGLRLIEGKKALVYEDNNMPIGAVVSKRYGIVQNSQAIDTVFEGLDKLNVSYNYDPKSPHNFLSKGRMRMFITLPDFRINDGKLGITPAFWIVNSYDGSTALSISFGYLRLVCTNGMVRVEEKGMLLARKHTTNISFSHYRLEDKIGNIVKNIPVLEEKITISKGTPPPAELVNYTEVLPQALARRAESVLAVEKPTNIWDMYNVFTNIVSHEYRNKATQPVMARAVARLFQNYI